MLEKLILGMLLYKNLTIYDMKRALDEGINQFFSTSYGALHPATKKLATQGFVTYEETSEKGRTKKVYELTPAGRSYFLAWLGEDISLSKIQEEGLLRVFFYKELPRNTQVTLLRKFVDDMRGRIAALEGIAAYQQSAKKEIPEAYREAFNYRVTTIDFGIEYYHFAIDWYERLIDSIQNGDMAK